MPNIQWSSLSRLQLGSYAEYYAKMEFASYGYDVYTSEVDDHGVDFVIKSPKDHRFYEVQVKSSRNNTYVFIPKSKMELTADRLVCLLLFSDNAMPSVYVIPATAWANANDLLSNKDYIGLKSPPEWGIQISGKNMPLLQPYRIENML